MSGNLPFLHVDLPAGDVRALALVLHGGRSKSHLRARANQLAVLRMRPFASSLRRAGSDEGLAVARVRYLVRGWNGAEQSPVADVQWALDELAGRFGGVPTALVGHSMGGRAAVYCAAHESVRAVVGLAPWIEPGDPVTPMAGRRLLFAHGSADRMTSAANSAAFARDAAAVAESAAFVTVQGDRHAMLRRASLWHQLSVGFVLGALCDASPEGTVAAESAKIVERALAGDAQLRV